MNEDIQLAVVTSCVYPIRSRIHLLEESCERLGINLLAVGFGQPFFTWSRMLMEIVLPAISSLSATHILYLDGQDSLLLAPESEIIGKYLFAGSPPCFLSCEQKMFPACRDPLPFSNGLGPFPNGGGWIGERTFLLSLWSRLSATDPNESNYQKWLIDQWPIPDVVLDTQNEIFQTMDIDPDLLHVFQCGSRRRVENSLTGSFPCVLHFAGGYSDPLTGRDERMMPWVNLLR